MKALLGTFNRVVVESSRRFVESSTPQLSPSSTSATETETEEICSIDEMLLAIAAREEAQYQAPASEPSLYTTPLSSPRSPAAQPFSFSTLPPSSLDHTGPAIVDLGISHK